MGCCANIIYSIVQFVAFVLVAVSVPLDMFHARKAGSDGSMQIGDYLDRGFCITMWGLQEKCFSTKYMEGGRPDDVFGDCSGRASRFKATQVCAIVTLAIFGVAALFGFLQNCYSGCLKWLCVILNAAGVVTAIVAWACMLDCWMRKMGTDDNAGVTGRPDQCVALKKYRGFSSSQLLPDGTRIGAGFILLAVGSALGFVNVFIILIPC